jgi:hypothetical protein
VSPERAQPGQYEDLLRLLAFILGIFLLADSVTQLVQASSGLNLGNRNWRITNFRLLFTQVTPIVLGLLLVGQYIARKVGWRATGMLAFVLAVPTVVLGAIFLVDALALMGTLSGAALGQLKRNTVQVVVSALSFGLALLWVGMASLKARTA